MFGRWVAAVSDERIKKEIEDINDNLALHEILAIQPRIYKYIDDKDETMERFMDLKHKKLERLYKKQSNLIRTLYQIFIKRLIHRETISLLMRIHQVN